MVNFLLSAIVLLLLLVANLFLSINCTDTELDTDLDQIDLEPLEFPDPGPTFLGSAELADQNCDQDVECPNGSVCVGHVCKCKIGYTTDAAACSKMECTQDEQCSTTGSIGTCCVNGTCVCDSAHSYYPDKYGLVCQYRILGMSVAVLVLVILLVVSVTFCCVCCVSVCLGWCVCLDQFSTFSSAKWMDNKTPVPMPPPPAALIMMRASSDPKLGSPLPVISHPVLKSEEQV